MNRYRQMSTVLVYSKITLLVLQGVGIPPRRGVLDTTLCDKVCQWLATGRWFFPVTPPPIKLTATI